MRFGVLAYHNTNNLGDEIQSLAAMRFLPQVDYFIDRDALGDFKSREGEPVAVILNGWFSHRADSWPPSKDIVPLLTSMHFSPYGGEGLTHLAATDFFLRDPAAEFLRRGGPVGARDLHTLDRLQERQIPSFLSGCLTLTLERDPAIHRGEAIVLNDVPEAVVAWVRARTSRELQLTDHVDNIHFATEERFQSARALLARYQSAHCVITTRLHCALPCLALGTPVLLLDVGQDPTRFAGLMRLLRHCTVDELFAGRIPFDLEHPAPNSVEHLPLRVNLEAQVRRFLDGASGRVPLEEAETPASLRAQTLAHLYADRTERLQATQRELTARTAERDRLVAEKERLEAEIVLRAGEQRELQSRYDEVVTSSEWRAASLAKRAAGRFPTLTAPFRALAGRILKR